MALVLAAGAGDPDVEDPWFSRDKVQHFGVSAALAGGAYFASGMLFDDRRAQLIAGAGLALTFGVAEEIDNLGGSGVPSWLDMTWNLAGTLFGLTAAWLVDRYFLIPARDPAAGAASMDVRPRGVGLVIVF